MYIILLYCVIGAFSFAHKELVTKTLSNTINLLHIILLNHVINKWVLRCFCCKIRLFQQPPNVPYIRLYHKSMSVTHQDTILRDNIKSNSTQSGVKLILLPLQQCTHWQTYWGLDKLPTPRRQYLAFSFYINPCILIKISPEFVPTSNFFYNKSTLVQVMAWGQTGYKPLPEFEGILPKGPYQRKHGG